MSACWNQPGFRQSGLAAVGTHYNINADLVLLKTRSALMLIPRVGLTGLRIYQSGGGKLTLVDVPSRIWDVLFHILPVGDHLLGECIFEWW